MHTKPCKLPSSCRFSNKIVWFSFIFSIFVIWVHSYNAHTYLGDTQSALAIDEIQHWIGDGIGQIAVPGFFVISGYLFYRNLVLAPTPWIGIKNKWKTRIRSVLIPFILWNTIYYFGYVISSRIAQFDSIVGKGVVPFSLFDYVDAVIHYRYNYVFWYLYQLILVILLAPIIYQMIKNKLVGILFWLGLWIVLVFQVELPHVNEDALVYYTFGAYLGIHKKKWVEESVYPPIFGIAIIVIGSVLFRIGLWQGLIPLFVISRLLCVCGLWIAVSVERLPKAAWYMKQNFFLYATHFAFVRLINKGGALVLPHTATVAMILYIMLPLIVLVISLTLGMIVKRIAPCVWNVLNGNRN